MHLYIRSGEYTDLQVTINPKWGNQGFCCVMKFSYRCCESPRSSRQGYVRAGGRCASCNSSSWLIPLAKSCLTAKGHSLVQGLMGKTGTTNTGGKYEKCSAESGPASPARHSASSHGERSSWKSDWHLTSCPKLLGWLSHLKLHWQRTLHT